MSNIPSNNTTSTSQAFNRKQTQRQLKRIQLQALNEDKKLQSEQSDALFFNNGPATSNTSNAMPPALGMPASEHKLSDLPFLSQDMAVYIEVIASKLIAKNPLLESLVESLYAKLDDLMAADDGEDLDMSSLESLLSATVESGVTSFEVYVLLYEFMLKKKRAKRRTQDKDSLLELIEEKLTDMENSSSIDILTNLKSFNNDTSAKLKLIKEFKGHANSYHGEYSEIIQQVVVQYEGNFRTMIKDMLKLSGHNISSVYKDSSRTYEQQSFIAECVYLETKILNLMSLFCKLEPAAAKLSPQLAGCNPLQLSSDLVDLLDGFDCNRLINNKLKALSDPQQKQALIIRLLNLNIEAVRYLPANFFKQEKDRENLSQRLKDSSLTKSDDKKKPLKAFI